MPTYAFRCPKCHNEIELIMKISEYTSAPRPLCAAEGCDGQVTMETQLQAAPFALKGAGWTPKFEGGAGMGPSTDLLHRKRK